MSALLSGYDMVVAITQNEINSQFQRMASSSQPVIDTYVEANGLSTGWGSSYLLSSYIRGYVDPPTVQFRDPAAPDSHDHVFFNMTFQPRSVNPADLGLDTSRMIIPAGGDGKDGYVIKTEDIPYTDAEGNAQTLRSQNVYYWLRQTGSVGTTKTWELVPAVYFFSDGAHALVDLESLQLTFKVQLAMIPTTPDQVQALVDDGLMDPSVLQTITDNGFNSMVFSLQQLFLDFDTVDFTQWDLAPVTGDPNVKVILIELNQMLSEPLTQLTKNNQDFTSNFSEALQYAFGVDGENEAGRTPYILGINASSNNPADSNPGQPPSLVPTYIGFGTSANPSVDGLSTINYQVLSGANPAARVPRNGDGSVAYVTSTLVTDNNYSGSILFDDSVFFDPFVLAPVQQATGITSGWTRSGTTVSVTDSKSGVVELNEDYTKLGEGIRERVTKDYTNSYRIDVSGDTITVSGSCYQRQDITIDLVILTGEIPFHWWMWCTVSFSQVITMAIDANNQLVFTAAPMTINQDGPHQDQNFGGAMVDAVSEAFKVLSLGYFDPMEDALGAMATSIERTLQGQVSRLNNALVGGTSNNFISPTGDVFLLHAPHFNADLDLVMDGTYRV